MLTIVQNNFSCFTVPKRHILDSSKLKESADDNFEFDENSRKFSERVRKHCGLIMSNFSFSHGVFKRIVPQTRKSEGLFGRGLKEIGWGFS